MIRSFISKIIKILRAEIVYIKNIFRKEVILTPGQPTIIHSNKYRTYLKTGYTLAPVLFLISLLTAELIFTPKMAITHGSSQQPNSTTSTVHDVEVHNNGEVTDHTETFNTDNLYVSDSNESDYVSYEDAQANLQPSEEGIQHEPVLEPPQTDNTQTSQKSLNADYIFNLVNNHRTNIGLSPFEKDENLCSIAQTRATEIPKELSSGTLHSGIRARGLSGKVIENAIMINSEQRAFNWWMNSNVHRASIEGNKRHSCTKCSGNSCVQLFSSLNLNKLNYLSQDKITFVSYDNCFSFTSGKLDNFKS